MTRKTHPLSLAMTEALAQLRATAHAGANDANTDGIHHSTLCALAQRGLIRIESYLSAYYTRGRHGFRPHETVEIRRLEVSGIDYEESDR